MATRKYGDKRVIDLSDWGRPLARLTAKFLKNKPISVIQVTNIHLLLTIFCSWLILNGLTLIAFVLLVVKGVIDAVDGELAQQTISCWKILGYYSSKPSHVGRYWDTIADSIQFLPFRVGNNILG